MNLICKRCNKQFESNKYYKVKYCSPECKKKFLFTVYTCERCGKQFKTNTYYKVKYCSPECRKKFLFTVYTCKRCDKQFKTNTYHEVKFCSSECRKRHIRCKNCNNLFSGDKRKRFCSDSCKHEWYNVKTFISKTCLYCNKEIKIKYYKKQKYCSSSCAAKNSNKKFKGTTIHGCSNTKLYKVWNGILQRCLNTKNIHYKRCGAIGIKVDPRWKDFRNFKCDVGDHPGEMYKLKRINQQKGFNKNNCHWVKIKNSKKIKMKVEKNE